MSYLAPEFSESSDPEEDFEEEDESDLGLDFRIVWTFAFFSLLSYF